MKADDFRALSDEELVNHIDDLKRNLLQMRIQLHSGQLSSSSQVRGLRRDIARALTVQNERRQAAPAAPAGK
ncbi:MAG TPA: 50S ribosomal protein L29 [bacterium]|nr:50S ribosomal protein L29 [bacterium]HQO33974.1 50S ribosomal protein L29 [bacterium]HQQ00324.1 50S ribosomal protein L29 [bacterium]